jgi:hypothetical protein
MKRNPWSATALALGLALASRAGAAESSTATEAGVPKAASPTSASGPVLHLVGTLASVDSRARSIQLASYSVRLQIEPDARIIRNGHRASLAELRLGDRVRATCARSSGAAWVRTLDATSVARW